MAVLIYYTSVYQVSLCETLDFPNILKSSMETTQGTCLTTLAERKMGLLFQIFSRFADSKVF